MGTQGSVVDTVRRAESGDVVALGQTRLPGVTSGPPRELSELGEREMEFTTGGLVLGRLVEQLGDHPELLLGQREHRAAPSHIVHRAQLRDQGQQPVSQPG